MSASAACGSLSHRALVLVPASTKRLADSKGEAVTHSSKADLSELFILNETAIIIAWRCAREAQECIRPQLFIGDSGQFDRRNSKTRPSVQIQSRQASRSPRWTTVSAYVRSSIEVRARGSNVRGQRGGHLHK